MVNAETQLKDLAGQIKSKVNIAITHIKQSTSSTPIDLTNHTQTTTTKRTLSKSSSSSTKENNEDTNRTFSNVFNTLFASCTGNFQSAATNNNTSNINTTNHNNNANANANANTSAANNRQPTKLGKKAKSALHNLQKTTSSRDECFYAQFYEDDHGRAARAVLLDREREEKERLSQRRNMKEMHSKSREEAGMRFQMKGGDVVNKVSSQRTGSMKQQQQQQQQKQHRENIRVGGNPYRLCEVGNMNRSTASEDSESSLSYNYDDGISAISAHTLDEMAKADMILQRKIGIPREQGFDIALESTVEECDAPPDLDSTAESSDASEHVARIQDIVEDHQSLNKPRAQKPSSSFDKVGEEEDGTRYPVQMARARSQMSGGSTESSTQSDHSEWKNQDAKYWMQVADEDTNATKRDGPVSALWLTLHVCTIMIVCKYKYWTRLTPILSFVFCHPGTVSPLLHRRNTILMIHQFAPQDQHPCRRKRKVANLVGLSYLEDERNTWNAMTRSMKYRKGIEILEYIYQLSYIV